MDKIGFLTPYNHLTEFTKFVENNFICIDLRIREEKVDYIFSAPNYKNCRVTSQMVEKYEARGIITPSTGTNHIETDIIPIYSIKNDSILEEITSTAEHNLYLCFSIIRNTNPIRQLSDLTLGILGYGRLGKMIYDRSLTIFKNVLIKDINFTSPNFFEKVDILSVNIDLNSNNIDLINKKFIEQFKKSIYIINTSRGEVVNENDILNLIDSQKLLGYATDVVKNEHTTHVSSLTTRNDDRIIVTPHIGGTAIEAQEKTYKHVITKIL